MITRLNPGLPRQK